MTTKRAFTLVELSIVLVILGLLTGGIVTGQSLIRAAELRSVTTDFNRFQTAIYTFRDKYFYLPGDMPNATDFWQSAGGNGQDAACLNATSVDGSTCNGNGNGHLHFYDGVSTTAGQEWFHAWVHLANAGLVEGTYTGRRVADDRQAVPGVNVPTSKLGEAGFTLMSLDTPGSTYWYTGNYNPMILLGSISSNGETRGEVLSGSEAWGIDKKIDDGKPGTGRLRTRHYQTDCVTSVALADQLTAQYTLDVDNPEACSLHFHLNSDAGS